MYDAVIAGAGTAGATLAIFLARGGLKVLLVDRASAAKIGHDWSDSVEKKPFQLEEIGEPSPEELSAPIRCLEVRSPDLGSCKVIEDYPYSIVDRKIMAARLLRRAQEAGAEFREGTAVLYPLYDEKKVFGVAMGAAGGGTEEVMARVTVDAAGIDGVLRCKLPKQWDIPTDPLSPGDCARAYREVRRFNYQEADEPKVGVLKVCYGRHGGYSWINRESEGAVDIGAGVRDVEGNPDPKELVHKAARETHGVMEEVIRGGGGRLPVRRALDNMVWDGFLVLGDSASQAVPVNGCNCGTIMLAARMAAHVIVDAVRRKRADLADLWRYNVEYQRGRGSVLAYLDAMRCAMQSLSEGDIDFLFRQDLLSQDQLRRSWSLQTSSFTKTDRVFSLMKGLSRPRVLLAMDKAVKKAERVLALYRAYPKTYDPQEFAKWKSEVSANF